MRRTITVNLKDDYLDTLSKNSSPVAAIAELIWNALDADAQNIRVILERSPIPGGAITAVQVIDDGHGIAMDSVDKAFEGLGGSWKKGKLVTATRNRPLHGKEGKGRFMVFGLGEKVEWQTTYKNGSEFFSYMIEGNKRQLGVFTVGDEVVAEDQSTSTTVKIIGLDKRANPLSQSQSRQWLTRQFAVYLRKYPDVRIVYDGVPINPDVLATHSATYNLLLDVNDINVQVALDVVEWQADVDRRIYFCDENGFALSETKSGIQAKGFDFTAYAKSAYFRELKDEGRLQLEEIDDQLRGVTDKIKGKLREHFRIRAAERSRDLIDKWIKEGVYPYEGKPQSEVEAAERQVFEVISVQVNDLLPEFDEGGLKQKRLQLKLMRQALERGPDELLKIVGDVLDLPQEKQKDLAQLLEKTSLSNIISATKLVHDRLSFLGGFQGIIYQHESKKSLKERSQLHKILEQETWIFGEEYHLTVSDKALKEVLRKHLHLLGRSELAEDVKDEVLRDDGSRGIVDLMLTKTLARNGRDSREHLIVELKAPRVKIDATVIQQLKSYAFAVAGDERFKDSDTKWVFVAVSNEMDEYARKDATQSNRPFGLIHSDENITIWVKPWAIIIEQASARMSFYKQQLNIEPGWEEGIAHLKNKYSTILLSTPALSPPSDGENNS